MNLNCLHCNTEYNEYKNYGSEKIKDMILLCPKCYIERNNIKLSFQIIPDDNLEHDLKILREL